MVSTFVAERNVLETPRAHRTWTQKVKPLNQKMLKMFLFSSSPFAFSIHPKTLTVTFGRLLSPVLLLIQS